MSMFNHLWRRLFETDSRRSMSVGRNRSHRGSQRRLGIQPLEDRKMLSVEPHGPEFQLNNYTSSVQTTASIAIDADGDFVVAWASDGQDGSGYGFMRSGMTDVASNRAVNFA